MDTVKVITQDIVNVHISKSNEKDAPYIEKRFQKGITVSDFKAKLELITGGSASTMQLQVYDIKNNFVCSLDNDTLLLGSYPIDDGMRVHVVDKFVICNEFMTTDSTEKFALSEEEYSKKEDTLRSFLQRNKLGKYDAAKIKEIEERQEKEAKEEETLASSISVGSRCEVKIPNQPTKRATVMYNGLLEGRPGLWIGLKYDEPLGKNDGSINGKRYFTCLSKYGGFTKPAYVTTGDFPVEDFDFDEEI